MEPKRNLFGLVLGLNWSLIMLITLMSCVGFAMLYSAADGNFDPWASRQIIRFSIFFPVMLLIALIDIRVWFKLSYIIYFIMLMALVYTEFFGVTAMGATRWIRIGSFNLQPSEVMKICVVFALAHYFHNVSAINVGKILYIIPPMLIVATPAILVLKQPDLGTAFIIISVGAMIFFAAGVQIWKFVVVSILGLLSMPLIWMNLHAYQKKRVVSFLKPESDPLGDGYNLLQSKIAIGSGGFSGKGFAQGTQSQLSFLPEKQTDFIFTMLAEEFGFVGGVLTIIIYLIIITYGVIISINSKNHFGRIMGIGVTSIFFMHVFINIAMVTGIIPVVGAPLPLLSYGGTIMITMLVSFGLLLNVHLYKDRIIEDKSI